MERRLLGRVVKAATRRLYRAPLIARVGIIVDRDGRHTRLILSLWLVQQHARRRAGPANMLQQHGSLPLRLLRHINVLRVPAEFCECVRQVLSHDQGVRRILVLGLPAVRGRRRRRDEEQLLCLWGLQMLVDGGQGGVFAKVDADAVAEDGFAIEGGADGGGSLDGFEGADDAAEGLEG